MSVYLPRDKEGNPRSRTYLFDFKLKPKGSNIPQRFYGSTGQTAEKAAKRVEQRLKELAKLGQLSNAMTIGEACKRYWDEKMEMTRSSDDQATNLELVSTLLGSDTLLVDVTPEKIAAGAAQRARMPLRRYQRGTKTLKLTSLFPKPATVNRQFIEPLRRLLRYAKTVWKVPLDLEAFDWSALKYEEPEERVRELGQDEEVRYWAELRADYHPIIEMYLISGRRKGDWVKRPKSKVNLGAGTVTMPMRKKKRQGEISVTLTEREIEIIREECAKAPECPYVFTYEGHTKQNKGRRLPITEAGLRMIHQRARKRAGLPDFRLHDTRHTFASRLLRAKGNLKLVSKALDHSSIKSTTRYLNVSDGEVVTARSEIRSYRHSAEHNVVAMKKIENK